MRYVFVIISLSVSFSWGASKVITPSGNFGGGLNLKTVASQIAENESPDMQNFINDAYGASVKRNGSMRYISQTHSTYPFTSLYRAYSSTGTEKRKVLLSTTRDRILYSTGGVNPFWVIASSRLAIGQSWEYVMFNNDVVMTGDSLVDPIKRFNVLTSSMTDFLTVYGSTAHVNLRAKHIYNSKDQLFLGNVVLVSTPGALIQNTTHYPSRIYYGIVTRSSFTHERFFDFQSDDGEQLNKITSKDGVVHFWKETKIAAVDHTNIISPIADGGNTSFDVVATGFGLIAPRGLTIAGDWYVFAAKDGIRFWNGSVKTRQEVDSESRVVSDKIQPIVDRCIRAGTWENTILEYYPKKQWVLVSLEDPERHPRGANNTVLILDMVTLSWYRVKNWNAGAFESFDGTTDNGELFYVDSIDGYVYQIDLETQSNDARLELKVHDMDNNSDWLRGQAERNFILEGTGSVRMTTHGDTVRYSSISYMSVLSWGEFPDKTLVTKDNSILTFKVRVASVQTVTEFRVDLEVNGALREFDVNFTSVSFSSSAFSNAIIGSSWTTFEIPLSSFPILNEWVSISSEAIPFADALTFYGIRFFSTGTGGATFYIDDVRIALNTQTPLNAYRYTKQFDFGSLVGKDFKGLILHSDIPPNSTLVIDTFKEFGQFIDQSSVPATMGNDIFVSGFDGAEGIARLNSIDYSLGISSSTQSNTVFAIRPINVDSSHIYGGDQRNDRIVKIEKSSYSVFVSSFGSFGSGTTNFYLIYQIGMDEKDLYICDFGNNRLKVHRKSNLAFIREYGQLGEHTTSFYNPSGIAVDERNIFIAQDGSARLQKLDKSNFRQEKSVKINLNTVGNTTLAVDQEYLYLAYNYVDPSSLDHLLVILEKRDKSSLNLLNTLVVLPKGVVSISTYALTGDITLSDKYLYIPFTDDANETTGTNFYIQKRLKSDFSLVSEYASTRRQFAVAADGISYKPTRKIIEREPGTAGKYIQFRYSESGLDNRLTLYDQALSFVVQEVR